MCAEAINVGQERDTKQDIIDVVYNITWVDILFHSL